MRGDDISPYLIGQLHWMNRTKPRMHNHTRGMYILPKKLSLPQRKVFKMKIHKMHECNSQNKNFPLPQRKGYKMEFIKYTSRIHKMKNFI